MAYDLIKAKRLMEEYWSAMDLPVGAHFDRTPERIVEMHRDSFLYAYDSEPDFRFTTFEGDYDQLIVQKEIAFSSWCGHHLLPFFGVAHIGYLPDGKIVGLSKLARVVAFVSRQPTTQEILAEEIAQFLLVRLNPQALFVSLEAKHTCIMCRGAEAHGSITVTNVCRGPLGLKQELKEEFTQIVRG